MKFSFFHKNKNSSDEELVAGFHSKGDMELLGELFNRYLDMLGGLCMKYFKDKNMSEDAVMEIFEVVARRLPNHEVENFSAWLYKVASNHCLDILRREKRINEKNIEAHRVYTEENLRQPSEGFNQELSETEEALSTMDQCIEELAEIQRKCIKMFYLEKQSYDTVATSLNITWSQTRSYIQNGRRNLKKCMEKNHETAR